MKRLSLLVLTAVFASSCAGLNIGGKSVDPAHALQAGSDLITALTISDEQVASLTHEAIVQMDASNKIAGSNTAYAQRLTRLTKNIREIEGHTFNFKVYLTSDINAFACADGSVRVFSGLMDVMNDEELMAIVGHEIGHVVNHDTKDAMKNAYLASAARNAVGSLSETTIGKLSNSELGAISQAFVGAQFSQKQEFQADEYGFKVSVENGYSPYAMSKALQKLVDLSGGAKSSSAVAKMFSSHPDSAKRSARMKEKADQYVNALKK